MPPLFGVTVPNAPGRAGLSVSATDNGDGTVTIERETAPGVWEAVVVLAGGGGRAVEDVELVAGSLRFLDVNGGIIASVPVTPGDVGAAELVTVGTLAAGLPAGNVQTVQILNPTTAGGVGDVVAVRDSGGTRRLLTLNAFYVPDPAAVGDDIIEVDVVPITLPAPVAAGVAVEVDVTTLREQVKKSVPRAEYEAALSTRPATVGGVFPAAVIPGSVLADYLGTVASEAAMLALDGQIRDWCIRSDTSSRWQMIADDPSVIASWLEMPDTPAATVLQGQRADAAVASFDFGTPGEAQPRDADGDAVGDPIPLGGNVDTALLTREFYVGGVASTARPADADDFFRVRAIGWVQWDNLLGPDILEATPADTPTISLTTAGDGVLDVRFSDVPGIGSVVPFLAETSGDSEADYAEQAAIPYANTTDHGDGTRTVSIPAPNGTLAYGRIALQPAPLGSDSTDEAKAYRSGLSAQFSGTPTAPDTTAPGPIADLAANPGDASAALSGTYPGDADFAAAQFHRSTVDGFTPTWGDAATLLLDVPSPTPGAAFSLDDDGNGELLAAPANGTTYHYVVLTRDGVPNQAQSNQASATPAAAAPNLLPYSAPNFNNWSDGGAGVTRHGPTDVEFDQAGRFVQAPTYDHPTTVAGKSFRLTITARVFSGASKDVTLRLQHVGVANYDQTLTVTNADQQFSVTTGALPSDADLRFQLRSLEGLGSRFVVTAIRLEEV